MLIKEVYSSHCELHSFSVGTKMVSILTQMFFVDVKSSCGPLHVSTRFDGINMTFFMNLRGHVCHGPREWIASQSFAALIALTLHNYTACALSHIHKLNHLHCHFSHVFS